MPWSYRRSAKIGPIRVNFSKSGISYSIGSKAFRYGKTAKGRSYVSSSPLPGLRYQRTISKPKSRTTGPWGMQTLTQQSPTPPTPPRMSQGRLALLISGGVLGLLGLLGLLGAASNGDATVTPITAPITVSAIAQTIPVPTARLATVVSATPTATAVRTPTPLASTAAAQSVTITAAGSVNLRSSPDTEAIVLTQVAPGSEATVIDADVPSDLDDSHWVHVTYAGIEGYIRSDLVSDPHGVTAQVFAATSTATMVPTPDMTTATRPVTTSVTPANSPTPPVIEPSPTATIGVASYATPVSAPVYAYSTPRPTATNGSSVSIAGSFNATSTAIERQYDATATAIERTFTNTINGIDATSTAESRQFTATMTAIAREYSAPSGSPGAPASGYGYSRPATGFYTDSQGRVRPITGSSGRHK